MVKNDYKTKIILISIVSVVFIVVTIFTFSSNLNSYSKYGTRHDLSGNFNVAKWKFKLTDGLNELQTINLNDTIRSGDTKVGPGASGVIQVTVDCSDSNGGSDVKLEYSIGLDTSSTLKPNNFKLYTDENYTEESNQFTTFTDVVNVGDTTKIFNLYWKWYYKDDAQSNENDSIWMNKNVVIALNVNAEQIVGDVS